MRQWANWKPLQLVSPSAEPSMGPTEELSSLWDLTVSLCSWQPQPCVTDPTPQQGPHNTCGGTPLGKSYHGLGEQVPQPSITCHPPQAHSPPVENQLLAGVRLHLCFQDTGCACSWAGYQKEHITPRVRLCHYLRFSLLTRGDKTSMVPPALISLFPFHVILLCPDSS